MTDTVSDSARIERSLGIFQAELSAWPLFARRPKILHDVIEWFTGVDWSLRNPRMVPRSAELLCPTWWLLRIGDYDNPNLQYIDYEVSCALEPGHASPHVHLETGDVRLGHELGITHNHCHHVHDYVSRHARDLDVHVPPTDMRITRHWYAHLMRIHDHRTCGVCPTEVW